MKKIEIDHHFFDEDIRQVVIFPDISNHHIQIDISDEADGSILLSKSDLEALAKAMDDNKTERIQLALDLAEGYDGMRTPDGLKSLINDMVKALKGEIEIIDIASHKQEGEE
jgi:hypothetical protein